MTASTPATPAAASSQQHGFRTVFRVVSGNFLEMYDFMVYGFYAAAIARTFFPSGNEFASLMLSLATFGAGFLMRPLGAIVLGAYIDHHGRRKGLILTLIMMAAGTLLIALVPGYQTIGVAAPLLVLAGRLLQGFSAGVELGGVSVYLSEIAKPGHKGFYVAWQSASQQVAVIFAGLLGVILHATLAPAQMDAWGWRVPFLIGCLIVPFLFLIRRSLEETEAFRARKHRPAPREIYRSMLDNWRIIIAGCLLVVMTTVSFYMITAYTPTFGKTVLKLDDVDNLIVTMCVGLSNFIWLPLMGAVSDRIGRKPLLVTFTILTLLTAYPAITWLVAEPSFGRLLMVELWLSFLYGSYNGAMVVALAELMPPAVRTTGFSLAYSLATALFGGFTPAVSTYLIHATGNKAAPGLWLMFAAACGLVATLAIFRQHNQAQTLRAA
ncbi:MFS transporter [Cupriavidus pampae]|uniref:Proline/betaine transporter n=1 Tax=Cupriavidus pampae TaxID=659251 RepID=A0ABM8WAF9_9BURK|nr:MFS transporter [Cupriavidus pampae]CAG9164256.1 Proline/betaine transporter [Cupriavidus pampae]